MLKVIQPPIWVKMEIICLKPFSKMELAIMLFIIKLKSRFQSQVIHNIWIKYDPYLRLTEGQNPIQNWYCTCRAGSRVFGTCAHVASVLWVFGVVKDNPELMSKRKCDLFQLLCKDSSN